MKEYNRYCRFAEAAAKDDGVLQHIDWLYFNSIKKEKYVVFCDLDMLPIPKTTLFDAKSRQFLSHPKGGFVFSKEIGEEDLFENQFWIFNSANEEFVLKHGGLIFTALELIKNATYPGVIQIEKIKKKTHEKVKT